MSAAEPCLCGDTCCRRCFRGHTCPECAPEPTASMLQKMLADVQRYAAAGDHECAHITEDYLLRAALKAIAGSPMDRQQCAALARLALEVDAVDYVRGIALPNATGGAR